jgi:hypothetical protein
MGFYRGSGTTIRHNTQSCTNNKGHITHNEYNTYKKSKAVLVIGCVGLQGWDVKAHRWQLGTTTIRHTKLHKQ